MGVGGGGAIQKTTVATRTLRDCEDIKMETSVSMMLSQDVTRESDAFRWLVSSVIPLSDSS